MAEQKTFHFIAIGGIGMSGLAKYLLQLGFEVTGSDIEESKYTKEIEELGAKVYIGHNKNNVPDNAIIVASTAIHEDNVELVEAKNKNLKIYHRSDILKLISDGDRKETRPYFIGFSGTHGKTTTSGLASFVLEKAGYKPSYVVGGIIPELHTNANCSDGKYFVAELDESDGTIVKYSPDISVINNLEPDHLDFFKDGIKTLIETFSYHISKLNSNAKIIVNNDCNGILQLINNNPSYKFITFGLENADYMAKNIEFLKDGTRFDFYAKGKNLGKIQLNILGKHNIYNAISVLSALIESGVDFDKIQPYFKEFTGMGRRFEFIAEINDIKIYDDYAHHPSEIKTTLESIKKSFNNRLVVAFQPHRYTRLKGLWDEFLKAFDMADELIVTDVWAASENKIEGINSENFVNALNHKNAKYIKGSMQEITPIVSEELKKGDLFLTMGAGNITVLSKLVKENLKAGCSVR